LYFRPSGAYLGIGLTAGHYFGKPIKIPGLGSLDFKNYVNVPMTFGYQLKTHRRQFIECQITPLLFYTISYGFGF
ncbi:MAG TPA: hypothetical protein VLG44_07725, partial [Chlamydiales bacterium]|nr:hypothetical protein [Chlamydiales bacterium]